MATLTDVAELIMGQSPPSSTYNEEGEGMAFFQGKTDFGFRHPTPKLYCSAPLKVASPNDILMSVRAPVGPTNIADRECCIGRGLAAIRPRNIDGNFLYFNLRYIEKFIASLGSGSTFHAINKSQLGSVEINTYNFGLPEQQKIAAVLGLVQRAIEQQARLIALTTELKKALLHKLFTEGLRGEPQKQTEIGPVPESWEIVRLSDSVSVTNGQVDPAVAPFSEMLHVGPENIESGTGRLLNLRTNSELRIHSGNYHFTADDVLYSKIRPYLNKVALPSFEGTCSADMYPLRAQNHKFVRSFLFQMFLSSQFNKQAISFQDRTGIPKINRAQLGSILLPSPDEAEQHEIADTLSMCDRRVAVTQQKMQSLTELFRALLHQLMTAQIRVNDIDLTMHPLS